jgi:hypothetical protein
MDTSHSVPNRKSYDLYLRLGERRLVWSIPDHGLTLKDDEIAWIAGGRQSQASLRDIVEVHLQIGYIEDNAIASCRLRFANGLTLSITSSKRRGFEAPAVRDAMHPQMRDCTSETARLRPDIPVRSCPPSPAGKNVNALLSEFRGTCGNYQHLKHALHLPRPLIKLL